MPAFRNIRLCDKDCMCLYVCPTGATDTENSIIDVTKCIPGCMECVKACPSGAISMLPQSYPPPQKKNDAVINALRVLAVNKLKQEQIAENVVSSCDDPNIRQFAGAVAKSSRRMAEDILREAGFMLPQSSNVHDLLEAIVKTAPVDFPKEDAEFLLENLQKTA